MSGIVDTQIFGAKPRKFGIREILYVLNVCHSFRYIYVLCMLLVIEILEVQEDRVGLGLGAKTWSRILKS